MIFNFHENEGFELLSPRLSLSGSHTHTQTHTHTESQRVKREGECEILKRPIGAPCLFRAVFWALVSLVRKTL